jgi:hypothetical protein
VFAGTNIGEQDRKSGTLDPEDDSLVDQIFPQLLELALRDVPLLAELREVKSAFTTRW